MDTVDILKTCFCFEGSSSEEKLKSVKKNKFVPLDKFHNTNLRPLQLFILGDLNNAETIEKINSIIASETAGVYNIVLESEAEIPKELTSENIHFLMTRNSDELNLWVEFFLNELNSVHLEDTGIPQVNHIAVIPCSESEDENDAEILKLAKEEENIVCYYYSGEEQFSENPSEMTVIWKTA